MPMTEVDDRELATLREGYKMLDGLLKNPKTRGEQEKLLKTLKPDVVTQSDLVAPVLEQVSALGKKFDDYVDGVNNKRIEDDLSSAFTRLKAAHHYTDEGIEKIQKLMIERRIPDPDAAAALFERLNPPAPAHAAGYAGTGWNFGQPSEDADLKLLYGDPDAWADKEIGKVLNDIRTGAEL